MISLHLSGTLACMMSGTRTAHLLTLLQGPDAIDSGNAKLLTIFVGLTAFAFLIVAAVAVVLAVIVFRVQKRLMTIVEEVKVKAMPIVDKTNGIVGDLRPKISEIADKTNGIIGDLRPRITTIVDDLTPKIKGVTDNVHHISDVVREKIDEFEHTISVANQTAQDATAKTHAQINRVDGMISSALTATAALGTTIHEGIQVPIREVTKGVSSLKAKFDEALKKTQGLRDNLLAGRGAPRRPNPPARTSRVPQAKPYNPSGASSAVAEPEFASVAPGKGSLDTL